MKRTIIVTLLLIVVISFLSLHGAKKCNTSICFKKCMKTNLQKEENLSPVYNFLSI
jgi:hypothetical protein